MKISATNLNSYTTNKLLNTSKYQANFKGVLVQSKANNEYYYFPFANENDETEISDNINKAQNQCSGITMVRIAPSSIFPKTCDTEISSRIGQNYVVIYNSAKE